MEASQRRQSPQALDRREQQVAGSCLCGGVRFIVGGTFERFYLCHCSRCRKDTGSAHAANLFSSHGKLTWVAGEDLVNTYKHPETRHARSFCGVCGSALPVVSTDLLMVPAGSLDTEMAIVPDAHIFSASRAAWDVDLHTAPVHASFPE